MKKVVGIAVALALLIPAFAHARDIEEYEVGSVNTGTTKKAATAAPATKTTAPATKAAPTTGTPTGKTTKMASSKESYAPPARHHSYSGSREGSFRLGFVGPGLGVASHGYGAFMTMGLEGEYFITNPLSVGLRMEVGTKFENPTLISFVPRVRYTFDFSSPRWSAYVQGGVGVNIATGGGTYAMADIAIPGGGFSWQWTENWSVGADASLHIFVQDFTAVGFTIGPTFRYQF